MDGKTKKVRKKLEVSEEVLKLNRFMFAARRANMIGYFVLTMIICALGGADSRHVLKTDLNYEGSTRTKCPVILFADDQSVGSTTIPMQLRQLRAEMRHTISVEGPPLDGYIVTSDDDHQSETVAPRDARRTFISGFSGSFGDAVVTQDSAVLWTSKLYRDQADRQLSCYWNLMIHDDAKIPTLFEWLVFKFQFSERLIRIGADPELVPASTWKSWQQATLNATVKLVAVRNNLVDIIWQNDRPSYNSQPAFVLDDKFTGRSWQDKIQEVRVEMKKSEADALVVTALDEIAWLLNIRGYDVPYTRVLRSYLVVTLNAIHLYAPTEKLFRPVHVHLRTDGCFNADCVRPHKYTSIWDDLTTMAQVWDLAWIPDSCGSARGASQKIATSIPADRRLMKVSPIIGMRARKNPAEVRGLQRAHIRDAASMCEFLFYMEEQISLGSEGWDELQAARLVDELRFEKDEVMGIAFATIAGYGPHGASPLYEATEATNLNIGDTSTLVVDSGGQYKDGTTDVTRTVHYGKPSSEQKEAYTRVLIGSIQLASLVFPASLRTDQLDALVRQPLWAVGVDYHHATGYGIGHFLSVHEAPIAITYDTPISTNATCNAVQLEPGYFFTNKPGFYREGDFGVRLGNVLQVVDAYPTANAEHKFRKFNDVTLVPYEPKLIETNMLSSSHRLWLNEYNKRIRKVIGDELRAQRLDKVLEWMMNKTESIPQLEGSKPDIFIPPAVDSASFPRLGFVYCILCFIFHILPFRIFI